MGYLQMTRNVESIFGAVVTAPHQIPYTYTATGGEKFISLPFYPVTGIVTINGGMQVPLDNFEIEGNTLNLGRALSKGDVVFCLFDKILSPEDYKTGIRIYKFQAIGGETEFTPDYTSYGVQSLYIGGEYKTPEIEYSYDSTTGKVTLQTALTAGVWVVAEMSVKQPNISPLFDRSIQEIARAANVKDSEVILSTDTTQVLNGKKVIYDVVAQLAYGLPALPSNIYIQSVSDGKLTYSPGSVAIDLLPAPSPLRSALASDNGAGMVGIKIPLSGGVSRTLLERAEDRISVKDFGAKGDGVTDDTAAIQIANDAATEVGATLFFPKGVYRCTDGIDKTCEWVGSGAAKIGAFPLTDDKVFMIPGIKNKLPGTCLLFTGVGTKSFSTNREDEFSSVRYCVLNKGRKGQGLTPFGKDLAIVCDFNYKNTLDGEVTDPTNDNSADYDVGLLMYNTDLSGPSNVTVGGYFKVAGTMHFGQDPDGCTVYELRTMGNIGLAIVGDGTGTNSAFNMHGGAIFGNDHHSRNVESGVEKWGKHALYIDIPSSAGSGSRNGISFHGTWLATKLDVPVKYDRCGAIQFFGVVFENATQAGSAIAGGVKKQIGTANTGDIGFFGCRFNSDQIRIAGALLETATESTVIISGSNAGFGVEFWKGKTGGRFTGSKSQTNIQLTDNPTTTTSGVVLRRDSSGNFNILHNNDIKFTCDGGGIKAPLSSTVATVSGGQTNVTRNLHKLSGGTQELNTLNGGVEGMRVVLVRNTSADTITLKNQTGNLRINGDFTLGAFDTIELIYIGGYWNEIGRVDRA